MTESSLAPLFTWRSAIASENGPSNSTTRLLLLTLSLHMSELGDSCFPSIDLLVTETGLSRRAVINNIAIAVESGWLDKTTKRSKYNVHGWRRNEYRARIPSSFLLAEAEQTHNAVEKMEHSAPDAPCQEPEHSAPDAPCQEPEHSAPDASCCEKPVDSSPEHSAPDDTNMVHQMHHNSPVNSTKKSCYGVNSIYYARQLVDIWQKALVSHHGSIETLMTCYTDDEPPAKPKPKTRLAGLRMLLTGRATA